MEILRAEQRVLVKSGVVGFSRWQMFRRKYLRRTDTVEERLQGSHHGHRQPSLHAVKEALAQRPLQRGTRNVYLRQRKRKAKPD